MPRAHQHQSVSVLTGPVVPPTKSPATNALAPAPRERCGYVKRRSAPSLY